MRKIFRMAVVSGLAAPALALTAGAASATAPVHGYHHGHHGHGFSAYCTSSTWAGPWGAGTWELCSVASNWRR